MQIYTKNNSEMISTHLKLFYMATHLTRAHIIITGWGIFDPKNLADHGPSQWVVGFNIVKRGSHT